MYNSGVFLKNMCSNELLLRGAVAPGLANCRGGGFRSTPFGLQRLMHGRWAGQGSGMYWWRKAASYSVHPNGRLTVLFKPGSASANCKYSSKVNWLVLCSNNKQKSLKKTTNHNGVSHFQGWRIAFVWDKPSFTLCVSHIYFLPLVINLH